MTQLILASQSVYRRQLLQRLNLPFISVVSEIDETAYVDEKPSDLAQRLAKEKAEAVVKSHTHAIIIGSDQVCAAGEHVLGKSGGFDRAVEQLMLCSGKTVHFYTAVCVIDPKTGQLHEAVDTTEVVFRSLDEEHIAAYLHKDTPYDCAGSFKVESLGVALFERVRSEDPTALIGLPLIRLCDMLRSCGMDPLAFQSSNEAAV